MKNKFLLLAAATAMLAAQSLLLTSCSKDDDATDDQPQNEAISLSQALIGTWDSPEDQGTRSMTFTKGSTVIYNHTMGGYSYGNGKHTSTCMRANTGTYTLTGNTVIMSFSTWKENNPQTGETTNKGYDYFSWQRTIKEITQDKLIWYSTNEYGADSYEVLTKKK